ncbi:hypothetical protein SGPA1_11691 [Streptomyces misionensis JCM 4497]
MDIHRAGIKKRFEREHPGTKVELVSIKAPDSPARRLGDGGSFVWIRPDQGAGPGG